MEEADIRLTRSDLPGLYHLASATSRAGQLAMVRLTVLLLGAGLASAVLALAGGKDGPSWHGAADIGAALMFAAASVGGAWLGSGQAQRRWYDGRAAAESIKTLSWKYAMCAAPFAEDDTADEGFLERMSEILEWMGHIRLTGPADPAPVITPAMRELRAAPVDVKRAAYERDRLVDQIKWYGRESVKAEKAARAWRTATIALGTAGVLGALTRAFEVLDLDALGLAAAGLASIVAWTQLRQYWPNAAAYRLAASELNVIAAEAEAAGRDDASWAAFCERAETAVSREHTMWRARAR